MVHSTDIVEFELRSKKFSLAVRKKEAVVQPEPMYLPVSKHQSRWKAHVIYSTLLTCNNAYSSKWYLQVTIC